MCASFDPWVSHYSQDVPGRSVGRMTAILSQVNQQSFFPVFFHCCTQMYIVEKLHTHALLLQLMYADHSVGLMDLKLDFVRVVVNFVKFSTCLVLKFS